MYYLGVQRLVSGCEENTIMMGDAQSSDVAYIFGYGSLLSSESRARTGISGLAIPCLVDGYTRTWSACVDLQAVGIVRTESNSCCPDRTDRKSVV